MIYHYHYYLRKDHDPLLESTRRVTRVVFGEERKMRGLSRGSILAAVLISPSSALALNTDIPAAGLPTATLFSASVLPDLQGVVSWKTLGLVEPVKQGGQMVPKFDKQILALDAKVVKVRGFVSAARPGRPAAPFPGFRGAASLPVLPARRTGCDCRGHDQKSGAIWHRAGHPEWKVRGAEERRRRVALPPHRRRTGRCSRQALIGGVKSYFIPTR